MRSLPRRALSVLLLGVLAGLAGEQPARADKPDPAAALPDAVSDLAHWVQDHHGQLGAVVVDIGSGKVMAASGEHDALSPASNAKLLTAATALSVLGPDYRYTTAFYGVLHDGAVRDLVLRGHGDPSLGTDDLWRMCRALVEMGLTRVDGDLLVDQSRFDDQFVPPAFDQQPNEWASFRAPVSAIALERNAITVNVIPQKSGEPAKVWVDPPGFASVSGSVETSDTGRGQHIRLSVAPDGTRVRATLSGSVAEGLPRLRFERRVDDPRLLPGYVAAHILASLGVRIRGGVKPGGAGVKSRLVFHRSRPLSALLQRLGKNSDNFYAEMILKTIGAEQGGGAGSSAAGAQAVTSFLQGLGALDPGTRFVNGSGLFDADRVSAGEIARVLRAAWQDPAIAPEYVSQLSIGGADGTLRARFRAHRQRRDIRAKTGTLDKAIALSGYVLGRGGSPVAFSFIVDGITAHADVKKHIDAVVERIASAR